jgi:ADP-heptose:LPS heptosyltransferase
VKTLYQIANAAAIITNDTMVVHAAASFNKPTIIIAKGNNYYRFTDYKQTNICTIYPEIFLSKLKKANKCLWHYTAVTKDIASIKAITVFDKLQSIIAKSGNESFFDSIAPGNI